jgi:type VI secretion system protein ImpA
MQKRFGGGGVMASAAVLDLAALVAPIPGPKPTGVDLREGPSLDSAYYAIKDARNTARAAERQLALDGEQPTAPADWRPVLRLGMQALAEQSKDLEITAYLIEALVRQHGFAGLRDGFRLARGLVENYWDGLYPQPDEDGLETRVAALTGLNGDDAEGTLLVPIARVPLTETTSVGRLDSTHYRQAVALAKLTDPKSREQKIAAGTLPLEAFQKAVAESAAPFYKGLVEDLSQCLEELTQLGAALDARCNGHAPPTFQVRTALESCLDVLKDVARAKLAVAPPPAEAPTANGTPAPSSGSAAGPGEALGGLRSRDDAFRHLLHVAAFFQRTEPHSIVPYALEQVVRWGRTSLPDLLTELIPDDTPRNVFFKQVGIPAAEPPKGGA